MINDVLKTNGTMTLKEYLENNKDILGILGVFIAVTALSANLSIKIVAAFISFSSFTCSTLILIEFWRCPIKKDGRMPLLISAFRVALFCLAFGFFLYWFVVMDAIYPELVFAILLLILLELFGWCTKRLIERKTFVKARANLRKRKVLLVVVVIIITVIVAIATLVIARFIANKIELPIFKFVVWVISASSKIQGPIQ